MDRAIKLIESIRDKLNLSLKGYKVLTEVGSNNYIYGPIIPLLCGAQKVYAFVKDTNYGKADEIKTACLEIATALGLEKNLEIETNVLNDNWLGKCDIITNSGMLRPFDTKKLSKFKKNAVLPLMYESWELRSQDIDISYCKEHNIKVSGTWESHPDIKVFDYVEILCLKMAFEAGFEVLGNNIFIWSNDHFGDKIKNSFIKNGANKCILSNDLNLLLKNAAVLDFLFISDYDELRDYSKLLDINNLIKINPNLVIIHLYGNLDFKEFSKIGFEIFPKKNGKSQLMTYSLAHAGLIPIINLQVAGYKVATEMLKNEYTLISQKMVC